MRRIFIGMLFVFINFNLDLGASRIGLIPSFVGNYLIYKGLHELDGLSDRFTRTIPFAKGMAIYSAICYALDIFGLSFSPWWYLVYILGLISIIFTFYISRNIILGIKDIEIAREQDLNSRLLYSLLKLQTVLSLLSFVLLETPTLLPVSAVVTFLIELAYLFIFNSTKELFYSQNTEL